MYKRLCIVFCSLLFLFTVSTTGLCAPEPYAHLAQKSPESVNGDINALATNIYSTGVTHLLLTDETLLPQGVSRQDVLDAQLVGPISMFGLTELKSRKGVDALTEALVPAGYLFLVEAAGKPIATFDILPSENGYIQGQVQGFEACSQLLSNLQTMGVESPSETILIYLGPERFLMDKKNRVLFWGGENATRQIKSYQQLSDAVDQTVEYNLAHPGMVGGGMVSEFLFHPPEKTKWPRWAWMAGGIGVLGIATVGYLLLRRRPTRQAAA